MIYLYSFLFVGVLCLIGEIILDNTNLTPGHITSLFVSLGAVLSFFSIYPWFVEKVGVASLEVYGDDVALMFHAFYDECLFPIQIGYHSAFLTAGTKAGGEHDELIV